MIRRVFFTTFFTVILAFVQMPAASVELPQAFISISAKGSGTAGVFHDSFNNAPVPLVFAQQYPEGGGRPLKVWECSGFGIDCPLDVLMGLGSGSGDFVSVQSAMPICEKNTESFCISNLAVKDKNTGTFVPLEPQKIGTWSATISQPQLGLPEGGLPSLWSSADKSKRYSFLSNASWIMIGKTFVPGSFSAAIYPTSVKQGSVVRSSSENVLWGNGSEYGTWETTPANEIFKVSMRIPKNWGKFAVGKLNLDTFKSKVFDAKALEIEISASPANVPFVQKQLSADFWKSLTGTPFATRIPNGLRLLTETGSLKGPIWEELLRVSEDKSSGTQQVWQFGIVSRTTYPINVLSENCTNKGTAFIGLVATDAMAVDSLPPTFENASFNYQISGLHYDSLGQITSGKVEYMLDAEIMKCAYKMSSPPVSAVISVISAGGESSVTTTSAKIVEKFLHIKADNIHFSSPVVSVKLTGPQKQATITCVKGKSLKKVTSVNPKCPVGYKKK